MVFKPSHSARSFHGFTLIELLVVVAIISLLVSILLPSLTKAKDLARLTACAANCRSIGSATHIYAGENDDSLYDAVTPLPQFYPWNLLLREGGYATDEVFHCPAHEIVYPTSEKLRSYSINGWITGDDHGFGAKLMTIEEASSYNSAAGMLLMHDAWRGVGTTPGAWRENTILERAENLCYGLWAQNFNGHAEHMPVYLVNGLFLDGHVEPYEHLFASGVYHHHIYPWYFYPYW
jgi:prepilin-type N-terminal cleavage/methylation domain-containing protein/prepilin-type processing-associated H-X9-DG protein